MCNYVAQMSSITKIKDIYLAHKIVMIFFFQFLQIIFEIMKHFNINVCNFSTALYIIFLLKNIYIRNILYPVFCRT